MTFSNTAPAEPVAPDPNYVGRAFFFTNTPQAFIDDGYDTIMVERRKSSLEDFEEISSETTRPRLRGDTVNYHFIDNKARVGFQYRPTIMDSTGIKPPIVQVNFITDAVDTSYESVLTVQELKDRYAWGLLDLFQDGNGNPFPDRLYVHYIRYGMSKFEANTRLRLLPTPFEEFHDHMQAGNMSEPLMFLMDEFPILSLPVPEVALNLPGDAPQTFPAEWIRVNKLEGEIYIVPTSSSSGFKLTSNGLRGRFIPQAYRVRYFAGFELGKLPTNIVDIVGKEAASGPLNIGGDLVGGAAIASQSMSLDGLSQSVNTTSSPTMAGFGARLIQYNNELKRDYPIVTNFWRGKRLYAG